MKEPAKTGNVQTVAAEESLKDEIKTVGLEFFHPVATVKQILAALVTKKRAPDLTPR